MASAMAQTGKDATQADKHIAEARAIGKGK